MGGSRKSGSASDVMNGVSIGTSSYGKPVPIVYGRNRVATNVIWMPQSAWTHKKVSGGGKGGAGTGTEQEEYWQGVMLAVCEGPVTLLRAWRDKEALESVAKLDSDHPFSVFTGTRPQDPWSYLSVIQNNRRKYAAPVPNEAPYSITIPDPEFYQVVHVWVYRQGGVELHEGQAVSDVSYTRSGATLTFAPIYAQQYGYGVEITYIQRIDYSAQAIGYGGTCVMASESLSLGTSNTLKNITVEVGGLHYSSGDSGDVSAATVCDDFLTNTIYGAGWSSGRILTTIGQDGTGASGFAAACTAFDYRISPVMEEAQPASKWIDEWLLASNASCVWGDGKLKFVPLADTAGTGYTPYLTPIYSLDRDDFVVRNATDDAIRIKRTPKEDTYNQITVEFLARDEDFDSRSDRYRDGQVYYRDDYNVSEQDAIEQADVIATGLRKPDSNTQINCITRRDHARAIADVLVRRSVYNRNKVEFTLPPRFALIEPLDLLLVSDDVAGVSNMLVRVTAIEEDDDLNLKVEAVEWKQGIAAPAAMESQPGEGGGQNPRADPYSALPPVVAVVNPTGNAPELWLGAAGGTKDYGGALVWLSWDGGLSYSLAGTAAPAMWGQVVGNMPSGPQVDTTTTLSIDMRASGGTLTTLTENDYNASAYPLVVGGEVIQYRTATLTALNTYDLTTLRRGLYGTAITSHGEYTYCCTAADMLRVPLPQARWGQTVYVKFQAFNLAHSAYQDLSTLPYTTFTIPAGGGMIPIAHDAIFTFDTFRADDWEFVQSHGALTLTTGGLAGGSVLNAPGYNWLVHRTLIPYNPSSIYQVLARVRQVTEPTVGGKTFYMGLCGVAADGVTLVNANAQAVHTGQHFEAAAALTTAWTDLLAYWSGTAAVGTEGGTGADPGEVNSNVRYVRPLMVFNFDGGNGVQEIDSYSVRVVEPGDTGQPGADAQSLNLTANALTFTFDWAGNPVPASQTIALVAVLQNLTGDVTMVAEGFDASNTSLGAITLGGTPGALTRTMAVAAFGDAAYAVVTATIGSLTDWVRIVRVAPAEPAYSLDLTSTAGAFTYDGTGAANPASQTITFSAIVRGIAGDATFLCTRYNDTGTSLGTVTLGGTGNQRTLTDVQFGDAAYADVRAGIGSPEVWDQIRVVRIQAGADGTAGNNGLNGADAQSVALTATAQAFTFDSAGTATPSPQTITFTPVLQNIDGTITWACTRYDAAGTALGAVTLGAGAGLARTLTDTQFGAAHHAVVVASLGGFQDQITVVRLQDAVDGAAGENAVSGYLTNESHAIAAAYDGTVSAALFYPNSDAAGGTFMVYDGTTRLTAGVTFSRESYSGGLSSANISLDAATGVYHVTGLTSDVGSCTFLATYGTVEIRKVYSIAKSRAGATGDTGPRGYSGVDALAPWLSREAVTLPATWEGALVGTSPYASTQFKVFQGVTEQPYNADPALGWSITASPASSTGSVTYSGPSTTPSAQTVLTVTGMAAGVTSHAITITATRTGYATLSRAFTITKSLAGQPGSNGLTARALTLASTSQSFTFNSTGAATPSAQTITFTPNFQNVNSASAAWTCVGYNAAGTSIGSLTLGANGDLRTLTVASFGAAARAVVTCSSEGFSDTVTVVRLQDALPGANAISGYLTNESHVVAASNSGVVSSSLFWPEDATNAAGGTFKVYDGTSDVTTSATFLIDSTSNVQIDIVNTVGSQSRGQYHVTGMTADVGTARLRAWYGGVAIYRDYVIAKARAGLDGSAGPRGSNTYYVDLTDTADTAWQDDEAWAAASTQGGPVLNDVVTETFVGGVETKFLSSETPPYGTWTTVTQHLNGNLVIDGTVGAKALAAASVTTHHLAVQASPLCLNSDPGILSVATAANPTGTWGPHDFTSAYGQQFAITDGSLVGRAFAVRNTPGNTTITTSELLPVASTKTYVLHAAFRGTREVGATTGSIDFGVAWYDAARAHLSAPTAAGWTAATANAHLYRSGYVVSNASFSTHTLAFGATATPKIPTNARFCRLYARLNTNPVGNPGEVAMADAFIAEKVGGDMVVDGTLSAGAFAGNVVRTTNYAFTGTEGTSSEVATAGAKMQTAPGGVALLVAKGNLKVGTEYFGDIPTFSRAHRSVAQNMTTGARINFDVEDIDSIGALTTGANWVFTCPSAKPGHYCINLHVILNIASAGTVEIQLWAKGAIYARDYRYVTPGGYTSVHLSCIVPNLAAAQQIYAYLVNNTGWQVSVIDASYIEIYRMAL